MFWHLYVYLFALIFGLIGFGRLQASASTRARTDGPAEVHPSAGGGGGLVLMRYEGLLTNATYISLPERAFTINWIVYLIFAAFVIVGCVNAVNLLTVSTGWLPASPLW